MYKHQASVRAGRPHRGARRVILAIFGALAIALSGFLLSQALPQALSEDQGPRPFSEAELLNLRDAPPEGLVAYDSPSLIDTGLTKKKQEVVVARYVLSQVGMRRVFALVPSNHSGNRLVGYLHVMDPKDPFHSDGLSLLDYSGRDQVMKKFPNRPMAPYYFEVTGGRRTGWVKVAIFGVLGLGGVWLVLVGGLFGRM
jgi:hypothetical protein